MKNVFFLKHFILLVFCVLFISACSSEPVVQLKESTNDRMVIAIPQDFDSLDPHLSKCSVTQSILFNIFQGLVMPSQDGSMAPALAENWSISNDATSLTFYLRKDVTFHDGTEFTADDVKYTYDRLAGKIEDEASASNTLFSEVIENIEIIDDYTVRININRSDARFLSNLYWAIIPENSGNTQSSSPIGAGPYKYIEYTPGEKMILKKNESYYEEGLPKMEEVEIKIIDDINTAIIALINKEIQYLPVSYDIISNIPSDSFVVEYHPTNNIHFLGLNNEFEPFKDLRVRQALNYAINRKEIIEKLAPNSLEVNSFFSPTLNIWYEDLSEYYTQDIEKAKELLEDAGFSDLAFTVKVPDENPIHEQIANLIKKQYLDAGIDMKIEVVDWNVWLEKVYCGREHEATIIGLPGRLDPDFTLKQFDSTYSRNFINFSNEKYDQLILKGILESDTDDRIEIYKEAQSILAEEAASVFIMDLNSYVAIDSNLRGFVHYPLNFIDLRYFEYI
ncbi:MAG: hypothetical protein GX076_00595 [Clostridiales bacterium]|nr:hypothetical protein [Clostridiales bacterium]